MKKYGVKPFEDFIQNTDFKLLQDQKYDLIQLRSQGSNVPDTFKDSLDGVINFLDAFQDMLVGGYKINPKLVFDYPNQEK